LTLGELLQQTERRLRRARLHYGHGTDNPRDEAAYLVLRGLGLTFGTNLHLEIGRSGQKHIESMVEKRIAQRIPVAYLLHEAWLAGLPFYVDRRVVVPRSHIAELLGDRLRPWLRRPARRVLDLCTGSGCLAILAARAFRRARVDATDISAAALVVAKRNILKHHLRRRIRLLRSDLFAALERVDYLKVGRAEAPALDLARLRRSCTILLTDGPRGCTILSSTGEHHVPEASKADIADAVLDRVEALRSKLPAGS